MTDLHGLGGFLAGAAVLSLVFGGVGFVAGYAIGSHPVADFHLTNSTIVVCSLSTGYYRNETTENATRCPEVSR